jgi:anthranilate synthase component 1
MKTIEFKTTKTRIIADTVTPVNVYLKLRQKFKHCLLLESSDYNSRENNSKSFICFEPLLTFKIKDSEASISFNGNSEESFTVDHENFVQRFEDFKGMIRFSPDSDTDPYNGLFGYAAYNAVNYFESIKLNNTKSESALIPEMVFSFFKYILVFNHFNSDMSIIVNTVGDELPDTESVIRIIRSEEVSPGNFKTVSDERSNMSDDDYKEMVAAGKAHCRRGDVFQIVLSRQFSQSFEGDDFNVYRSLRSVNPSPYLFCFDYGEFRLFGSSPESQIKIAEGKAMINPIAGTYKRTGNKEKDEALAKALSEDKKENAEHVMLVDLARNDLSREAENVRVKTYKEIQYFSHVIHIVSEVTGDFSGNSVKMMCDTFPAGTLSGAPKYKAMELIDRYENQDRGFYGGAVGFIGLNNDMNLAIAIRSFVSKNKVLYYQAGAGIVVNSDEENELNEVNNKLSALKKAVEMAEEL